MAFISFTVEGSRQFPLDMLRYDACWPAGSEDVDKVATTRDDPDYRTARRVRLTSQTRAITPDRWASFGWKVVKQEKHT